MVGVAAVVAGGLASTSHAQSAFRPTRPVKIISPLLPGGATDAIIRPIALKLSELWGQPVIVENRAGGGTIIGTQAVAQALPDGHTMGIAISAFTINPSLRKDLPYDTFKDITPITQIGRITSALVAHPAFPEAIWVRDRERLSAAIRESRRSRLRNLPLALQTRRSS